MEWVKLPELSIEIGATPVTWQDYAEFAQSIKHPMLAQSRSPQLPLTGFSAREATAYAQWLSHQWGFTFRLPRLEEMQALAIRVRHGLNIWRCWSRTKHGVRRRADRCLSEWLDCIPGWTTGREDLQCITLPIWLLEEHDSPQHGALSDRGYSFVTFRLVWDLSKGARHA